LNIENEIQNQLDIPHILHSPNSIFEIEDLPFRLEHLPDIFTQFRKRVESKLDAVSVAPEILDLPPCSFHEQIDKPLSPELFNLPIVREDSRAVM
jgi:deoxyribodipyrimidine photo-lyase